MLLITDAKDDLDDDDDDDVGDEQKRESINGDKAPDHVPLLMNSDTLKTSDPLLTVQSASASTHVMGEQPYEFDFSK